jgi:hypothetical protein
MKTQLIQSEYEGLSVSFTEDGWFNATDAASKFGKLPNDWLRLPATQEYLAALVRKYGEIPYFKTKRGQNGGTWLHPKLGVLFARWLDIDFAVWCDEQIDNLLRGTHAHYNWKRARSEAASSFKVMNAVLQLVRQDKGKVTASHHFSNEARMINWALTGEFRGLERDTLSDGDLVLLAKLEERNAVLIGCGMDYAERKPLLERLVAQSRPALTVAA